jgi:hypothetical protein
MGKRLLKHLWQAWRRAALVVADESSAAVLAAEIENASEKANSAVRASASPSLPSHDAGEATQRMPEKVTNALSPQKSKRACPDVPEKAVDLLPAGEAQGRLPNKAIRPRLPHKSKRAKGDVPEKATSRVPAGEAVKRAPAKAGRYLPPQKSLKRAVVQLPQKAVHCVPRRGGRNRVA